MHGWGLCAFLGCSEVPEVTESLSLSNCRHWLQHSLSLVHRVQGGSCTRFRFSFQHCKQLLFDRDGISISKQQRFKQSHWYWQHKHQANWQGEKKIERKASISLVCPAGNGLPLDGSLSTSLNQLAGNSDSLDHFQLVGFGLFLF